MPIDKAFAKQLRRLRKRYKLTQEEIAERAQLDTRYYQRIESKNPPSIRLDTVEKLAKAFRISIATLMNFRNS